MEEKENADRKIGVFGMCLMPCRQERRSDDPSATFASSGDTSPCAGEVCGNVDTTPSVTALA